jgi:hypothetical protein
MVICAIYPTLLLTIYVHLRALPPTVHPAPRQDLTDPEGPLRRMRAILVPTSDGRQMKTAKRTDPDLVRMSPMGRVLTVVPSNI